MKLKTYTIEDPMNNVCPLPSYDPAVALCGSLEEQCRLLFHGTQSDYCKAIEREGWRVGYLPYDYEDIRAIAEVCDRFGFDQVAGLGARAGLGFTLSRANIGEWVSLTSLYKKAVNYASRGGEAVETALQLCDQLDRLLDDNGRLRTHTSGFRRS